MLEKIKNYKTIVSNTLYLSVIQIITLISPLVALPYVITTIGKDNYGLIVFTQSITAYFFIIINFGLDISAVKDVSQNRNNKDKLSEIVTSILAVKGVLLLISAILYTILIVVVPEFRNNYLLFIVVFSSSIAEVLFPIWYYQGIERMATLSVVKFISLVFYLSTLFFVVTEKADYIYVPLLQSVGVIISAIIGFLMLTRVEKVKLQIPQKSLMISTFKDSTPFFLSRVSIVINSNIAQTVSGIFLGMGDVAAFDIAKKIFSFTFIPLQMLFQAIFPYNANRQSVSFSRKFLYIILGIVGIQIILVYFLAPFIVNFFGGSSLSQAISVVRILLIYLLITSFATYLGSPVLIAFGYPKPFNVSVFLSTVALLLCYALFYVFELFTLNNFAVALIIADATMLIYRYYYCRKYRIL